MNPARIKEMMPANVGAPAAISFIKPILA